MDVDGTFETLFVAVVAFTAFLLLAAALGTAAVRHLGVDEERARAAAADRMLEALPHVLGNGRCLLARLLEVTKDLDALSPDRSYLVTVHGPDGAWTWGTVVGEHHAVRSARCLEVGAGEVRAARVLVAVGR